MLQHKLAFPYPIANINPQSLNQRRTLQVFYLHKGVHGQYSKIRLALGVVDEIQIHKLLELQIFRLHTIDHIRKQGRHVLPHRHRGNHFLNRIFSLVLRPAESKWQNWKLKLHIAKRPNQLLTLYTIQYCYSKIESRQWISKYNHTDQETCTCKLKIESKNQ